MTNTQLLYGKRLVITGGTTGIGLVAAQRAIEESARVMISGSRSENVATALETLGANATGHVADVRDLNALDELARQAETEFGTLDVPFANAGLGVFAPLDQIDETAYDKQFDINVKGVFLRSKNYSR